MNYKAATQIEKTTHDFLKKHFLSISRGGSYFLNCLPKLYDVSLRECRLTDGQMERIKQEFLALDPCPLPTGHILGELGPASLRNKTKKLSRFQRAMIELKCYREHSGHRYIIPAPSGKSIGLDIDGRAKTFFDHYFPAFTPCASLFLNNLPNWCLDATKAIPGNILEKTQEVMRSVKVNSPVLAGKMLPRLLQRFQEDLSEVEALPIFSIFALELTGMIAEKKIVASSPKCSPTIFEGLAEIFGNCNAGVGQAATLFPHLYRMTVNDEIRWRFSEQEFELLRALVLEAGGVDPSIAGETLRTVVLQENNDIDQILLLAIRKKVKKLSAFALACLEIMLMQK